jgi:hypothetical protein
MLLFGLGAPSSRSFTDLPDLDELFSALNRRFFDSRLAARCEWSGRMKTSAGSCDVEGRLIRVSVPYHVRRPDLLKGTLAHEMCHLLEPNHGPGFRRLAGPVAHALGLDWKTFRYA